jgi:hypothetical protein
VLSRLRHVAGELHAEKVVHVRTERLFGAQGESVARRCKDLLQNGEREGGRGDE